MSRKSTLPQSRRHIFIFDEDWEFLELNYGNGSPLPGRLGISNAIRQIIHSKVRDLRGRIERRTEETETNPFYVLSKSFREREEDGEENAPE